MKRIVVRHVILMTDQQYADWAEEYGIGEDEVPGDIRQYLQTAACDAIGVPHYSENVRAQSIETTLSVRKKKGER